MATWIIKGTDNNREGTEKGWQSLNVIRNRNKELKDKPIVFVDDNGETHDDINNVNEAKKTGYIVTAKEEEPPSAPKSGSPVITPDGRIEYTICLRPMPLRRHRLIANSAGLSGISKQGHDRAVGRVTIARFVQCGLMAGSTQKQTPP